MNLEQPKSCEIPDCGNRSRSRGLCKKHYIAWYFDSIPGWYMTKAEAMDSPVRSDNLRKPNISEQRAVELASLIRLLP